jgi:hypothetical protein
MLSLPQKRHPIPGIKPTVNSILGGANLSGKTVCEDGEKPVEGDGFQVDAQTLEVDVYPWTKFPHETF